MKHLFTSLCLAAAACGAWAQQPVTVTVHDSQPGHVIPKEIYGQFAEELGTCISDGLWVGRDSDIPNTDGYRNDVLEALRQLKIPVLRWPGGCFADTYHWRDGIGSDRRSMINIHWGERVVDNAFGTHEFLNLCELLGAQPYVSMNVGSASPQESLEWMEYMTAKKGRLAEERARNGRTEPWKVKFVGVGNESWGCGGNMKAEYYYNLMRQYATFIRSYDGNEVYRVASGANADDYHWTEVLMRDFPWEVQGVSLHYYSVLDWNNHGSATRFTDDEYYRTLAASMKVDELLQKHIAIMDRFDPGKRVGLLLDEWGTWWDDEHITTNGLFCQQNTMRDAIVAALELNIFHRYTDRLRMCNIAQVANVLQSMVITDGPKMTLTPTYHVFRMYGVHQDATALPVEVALKPRPVEFVGQTYDVPVVDATASRDKNGVLHLTLTNTNVKGDIEVLLALDNQKATSATAEVLTADQMNTCNTFDAPHLVEPRSMKDVKVKNGTLRLTLPAKSIVAVEVR